MARRSPRREDLTGALQQSARRFGAEVHRYEEAVAQRLGLHAADLACLATIDRHGPTTQRQLSDLCGVGPGALAGAVERLERAGYVRRASDPEDRRRVVVQCVAGATARVDALHQPMLPATDGLWERYSHDELAVILDFCDRAQAVVEEGTSWLRGGPREGADGGPPAAGSADRPAELRAPLDGLAEVTLRFPRGAGHLCIRGLDGSTDLFRGRFPANAPTASVDRAAANRGAVSLRYQRSPLAWRARHGELALSPGVSWRLEAEGGLSRLVAELAPLDVRAVTVTGGVSHTSLELPVARGVVPVVITGGVSDLAILRPPGTAVRLHVRGGASNLLLDGRRVSTMGRDARWASTDGDDPDQYEIEISGGARTLTIAMS